MIGGEPRRSDQEKSIFDKWLEEMDKQFALGEQVTKAWFAFREEFQKIDPSAGEELRKFVENFDKFTPDELKQMRDRSDVYKARMEQSLAKIREMEKDWDAKREEVRQIYQQLLSIQKKL